MKNNKWNNYFVIGTGLIAFSVILHYVHYLMFHDLHHIVIFLVADIAFIPLEVFFVTIVLDKFLEKREHQHLMNKLNMLIGLFYTELGADVFQSLVNADANIVDLGKCCEVKFNWEEADFNQVKKALEKHNHSIDITKIDLIKLKDNLKEQKQILLNLIANPILLEHGSFSELLMAVFHIQEELSMRVITEDQSEMDKHDLEHLTVDLERVYRHISSEWVSYMKHLKVNYPYLFLSASIKNPYDRRENVVIEKDILSEIYAS